MRKILAYIEFISACVNAISKGAKTTADNWPTDNPFSRAGNDVPIPEQQSEPHK